MSISDSFFDKIYKKTNVSKDTILNLAEKLKNEDIKNEDNINYVIDEISRITGKEVSDDKKRKIVDKIINDEVPNDLDNMVN